MLPGQSAQKTKNHLPEPPSRVPEGGRRWRPSARTAGGRLGWQPGCERPGSRLTGASHVRALTGPLGPRSLSIASSNLISSHAGPARCAEQPRETTVTFTGLGLGGRFRAPRSALRVFGRWRKEVLGSRELRRPGPVNHPPRGREAAGAGPSAHPCRAQPRTACSAAGPPGQGGLDPRTLGKVISEGAGPPTGLPAQTVWSAALAWGEASPGSGSSSFPSEGRLISGPQCEA